MSVDWRLVLLLAWAGSAMICGAIATGRPFEKPLVMKALLGTFTAYVILSFILIGCVAAGLMTSHLHG